MLPTANLGQQVQINNRNSNTPSHNHLSPDVSEILSILLLLTLAHHRIATNVFYYVYVCLSPKINIFIHTSNQPVSLS